MKYKELFLFLIFADIDLFEEKIVKTVSFLDLISDSVIEIDNDFSGYLFFADFEFASLFSSIVIAERVVIEFELR